MGQVVEQAGMAQGTENGLLLLHTCQAVSAASGELLAFDSYVLNEGAEPLRDVRLVPASLTNADMTQLSYIEPAGDVSLELGALLPGQFAKFTALYRVSEADVASGGPIISAMAATAVRHDGGLVRSAADVILELGQELELDFE